MTDPNLIIALTIVLVIGFALGNYWGYQWAKSRNTGGLDHKKVIALIKKHLPDEWTAYRIGIHEGYEQGLRDAQEDHHEPTQP